LCGSRSDCLWNFRRGGNLFGVLLVIVFVVIIVQSVRARSRRLDELLLGLFSTSSGLDRELCVCVCLRIGTRVAASEGRGTHVHSDVYVLSQLFDVLVVHLAAGWNRLQLSMRGRSLRRGALRSVCALQSCVVVGRGPTQQEGSVAACTFSASLSARSKVTPLPSKAPS
jgi:hypothetical protein